jgi:hypothetical protein
MKSSVVFWGVFLILIGILLLLDNWNLFNYNLHFIIDFWPLILIVWGLSLLKLNDTAKNILAGLSGAFLALLIMAILNFDFSIKKFIEYDNEEINEPESKIHEEFKFAYDSAFTKGRICFEGAAGQFSFNENTNDLIYMESGKYLVDPIVTPDPKSKTIEIDIQSSPGHGKVNHLDNELNVKLNRLVDWDMDISLGAAEFDADFSDQKIKTIDLDAGAADIEITLGDRSDTTYIDISVGASDIIIRIPQNSGCLVTAETVLVDKDLPGFNNKEKNDYYTDNYFSSNKKIIIKIEGGVSHFEVERY